MKAADNIRGRNESKKMRARKRENQKKENKLKECVRKSEEGVRDEEEGAGQMQRKQAKRLVAMGIK